MNLINSWIWYLCYLPMLAGLVKVKFFCLRNSGKRFLIPIQKRRWNRIAMTLWGSHFYWLLPTVLFWLVTRHTMEEFLSWSFLKWQLTQLSSYRNPTALKSAFWKDVAINLFTSKTCLQKLCGRYNQKINTGMRLKSWNFGHLFS